MENANALPPTPVGWLPVTRIFPREAKDSCHPQPDMNVCEKPALSNTKLFIILTIMSGIFLTIILTLLFFLHRRKRRLDNEDKLKDIQELDDYGMAPESPRPTQKPRMPEAPPPVQTNTYSQHNNYERSQSQGGSNHRDWRTSAESLTPSFRQATPAVPRDSLANRF